MHIRLTQFLLVPVTTLFCMFAYSSTLQDARQDPSFRTPVESGVFLDASDQAGNPGQSGVVTGSESVTQTTVAAPREGRKNSCLCCFAKW